MSDPSSNAATSTGTATSRARQVRRAVRRQTHARLALSGPSGAGKTWTALSIAKIIAPGMPIVVIDTEPGDGAQGAAELYADAFDFDTIQWDPPYDPRDLTLTIRELGNDYPDGVGIIDSASHFWRGEGGTLDIAGGRFGGWKVATPTQDALVDAILRSSMHWIVCTRARQEYVQEVGPDGKQQVRKLGMAPVQRDDLEYEFQVVAMIDTEHRIDIGKTRAAPLAGLSFPANTQDRFGHTYAEWLAGGAELPRKIEVDALGVAIRLLPQGDARNKVTTHLRDTFGPPSSLTVDNMPAVWLHVAEAIGVEPHRFVPDEDGLCLSCRVPSPARWHDDTLEPGPIRGGAPVPEPDPAADEPHGDAGEEPQTDPAGDAPDAPEEGPVDPEPAGEPELGTGGPEAPAPEQDADAEFVEELRDAMAADEAPAGGWADEFGDGDEFAGEDPQGSFAALTPDEVAAHEAAEPHAPEAPEAPATGRTPEEEARIHEVVAECKALTAGAIGRALIDAGKSANGNVQTLVARLAAHRLAEEGIDVTQAEVKPEAHR